MDVGVGVAVAVAVDVNVAVAVDVNVAVAVDVNVAVDVDVNVAVDVDVNVAVNVGTIAFAVSHVTNGKYTRGAGHSSTTNMRLSSRVGVRGLPDANPNVAEVMLMVLRPAAWVRKLS